MPEISKTYEPQAIEEKWYAEWLAQGCFTADPARVSEKRPAYSIVIPPPNVTGVLTLGHVLNNTIQDILARRARMLGKEVLWLPGTDHAGIATQNVVERTLRKEGVIRHRDDLGREAMVEKIWEWKDKYGGLILKQLRALGASCDWSRTRFTMDEDYSRCVQSVFVDLYKKGLIYRGKRMVNWCPVALTALSDEEVIMKPQNGTMYYFRVEVVEEPGRFLTIATTRPETIPGDTAIAVNPNDLRYNVLIGKHVRRPLPREEQSLIPIIGDEGVDFEFGTGVLKVTPAHDKADFEIGQRHGLPAIDIMHPNGTMNAQAGPSLDGLDRFEARKRAAEILGELGLLEKEEPYQNNVGYSERADVPIEPRLSEQWFLKYPSVEQARACVERTDILGKSVRVVSTTGRVLAGGKMSELRKAALEFARQHGIIGSTIKNEDSGLELKIGRQSLTHAFSRTGEANIKAVVVLPELIRSAIWLSTEPHAPANPLFRAVHRFVACLAIEQTLYRVQITAKELADGTILYDHKTKKIAPGGKSLEAHLPKEKLDTQPAPNATVQVVQLVDKVNAGRISFHPPRWAKVYDHWMGNLQDWCISRQLWWGHRVPVWYRRYEEDIGGGISFNPEDVHVSVTPPPRAEEEWVQDSDVLDTWFSSWLWPFATMGWPEKTNTLAKFYPTTDLVTGPDIIFFWVARMIMAGFEYMGELPFKNVYFTGIIRDKQGRKMSKSLGNSPDPLDLIAKSGADALRFGVMRSAPLGADILFDEKNVELGRNFCTKLWNAARFRQMHLGEVEAEIVPESLTSDDKWILLRLDAAIREVSVALDEYRFSDAAQALYRFFWSEYCNWYLEASKAALYPSPDEEQIAAQQRKTNTLAVMDFVLGHTLRLFHPFLPFITEELWQSMGFSADLPPDQGGRTIMFAPWPKPFTAEERAYFLLDESDERYASAKFEVVDLGRGLRRDFKIASNKRVRFVFRPNAPLPPYEAAVLQLLLNAETLELVDAGWVAPKGTPAANTPLGELLLPLEGLIDVAAEHDRLSKEIVKAQDELARVEAKLANPNFAGKVPAAVLEEHQQRRASWAEKLAQLQRMLAALGE